MKRYLASDKREDIIVSLMLMTVFFVAVMAAFKGLVLIVTNM